MSHPRLAESNRVESLDPLRLEVLIPASFAPVAFHQVEVMGANVRTVRVLARCEYDTVARLSLRRYGRPFLATTTVVLMQPTRLMTASHDGRIDNTLAARISPPTGRRTGRFRMMVCTHYSPGSSVYMNPLHLTGGLGAERIIRQLNGEESPSIRTQP